MAQHGGRGNSYTFEQLGGQAVQRKSGGKDRFDNDRFSTITVYGDKMANRMLRIDAAPLAPIAERLHAMAVELVQSGELIPESVQLERVAARNRQHREAQEAHKAEALENFRCRARIALGINDTEQSDIVDKVVEAMKWAQSQ